MKRLLMLALTVSAVAVTGAIGVAPAGAAFPGANGLIAFDSYRTHNIYTIQVDGTHLRKLTSDGISISPRWSPDGTRIAYSRGGQLWVMSATGTNRHRVGTVSRGYQPAWSADGKRLAYVHVPRGQGGDIWTVPVVGGTALQLTDDGRTTCGDAHPVFSPLGGLIAYDQLPGTKNPDGTCTRTADDYRVITRRLATGVTHLIPHAQDPDFTADGKGFVFSSDVDSSGEPFPWNLFSAPLSGAIAQRNFITRVLCAEGDPCYYEGTAAPSSTLASPGAAFVLSRDNGDICIGTSITATPGFCKPGATFPIPENIDWQPKG